VVAHAGVTGGAWGAAQQALRRGRSLYVLQAETDGNRILLENGACALEWPCADPDLLLTVLGKPAGQAESGLLLRERPAGQNLVVAAAAGTGVVPTDQASVIGERHGTALPAEAESSSTGARVRRKRTRPAVPLPEQQAGDALDTASGPVEIGLTPGSTCPPSPSGSDLEEAVLHYLRHTRRKATGKGALLQVFPVSEALLDRALAALIAGGQVVEQVGRAGASYAAAALPARAGGFQLSLFGQQE
jgi:hypothetical protein